MSDAKQPAQQGPLLTQDQVVDAAKAGVKLLQLETTLVPGNLRKRIALLELILQQVEKEYAVLANPQSDPVESSPNAGKAPPKTPRKRAASRKK